MGLNNFFVFFPEFLYYGFSQLLEGNGLIMVNTVYFRFSENWPLQISWFSACCSQTTKMKSWPQIISPCFNFTCPVSLVVCVMFEINWSYFSEKTCIEILVFQESLLVSFISDLNNRNWLVDCSNICSNDHKIVQERTCMKMHEISRITNNIPHSFILLEIISF